MTSVRGSTPLWLACWEHYPQRRSQHGRTTLEFWSMLTIVPRIQLQGSASTTSCTRGNPTSLCMLPLVKHPTQLQHPTHQNLCKRSENARNGLIKKAETFQAKEVQWHKLNYDKRSMAVALEVGDTVLVHVTAFKGCHKIQDQWKNREYIVQKWPYPDVPIYVVCPRDGEGHSWTLA